MKGLALALKEREQKRKREEYSLVRDSRTSHTCTRRSMSPNSWNKEGFFFFYWVAWFMVNISIMEALFGWTESSSPLKTTQKSYCKIISKDKRERGIAKFLSYTTLLAGMSSLHTCLCLFKREKAQRFLVANG